MSPGRFVAPREWSRSPKAGIAQRLARVQARRAALSYVSGRMEAVRDRLRLARTQGLVGHATDLDAVVSSRHAEPNGRLGSHCCALERTGPVRLVLGQLRDKRSTCTGLCTFLCFQSLECFAEIGTQNAGFLPPAFAKVAISHAREDAWRRTMFGAALYVGASFFAAEARCVQALGCVTGAEAVERAYGLIDQVPHRAIERRIADCWLTQRRDRQRALRLRVPSPSCRTRCLAAEHGRRDGRDQRLSHFASIPRPATRRPACLSGVTADHGSTLPITCEAVCVLLRVASTPDNTHRGAA
jgi:hypothetical protein